VRIKLSHLGIGNTVAVEWQISHSVLNENLT
jgi:hypothetical protein